VCAFEPVAADEGIQISLELFRFQIQGLAALNAVHSWSNVHLMRSTKPLVWTADLRRAVLGVFHRQQQLVRMTFLDAAKFPVIVREYRADHHA